MSLVFLPYITQKHQRKIRAGCAIAAIWFGFAVGYQAYHTYQKFTDEKNIADLNEKVLNYKEKVGSLPDLNLVDLYRHGLTKDRLHRTPFGGYYRLNPKQPGVYNPNLVSR